MPSGGGKRGNNMKSKVVWKGGMAFTGDVGSGYLIPLDSDKAVGGRDLGFRPLQLFAIGLVGCTGMDVISILKKKRVEVTDFEVSANIESADQHPKIFTKILLTYKITGKNIDPDDVERAVKLSETKYCPAQAMLNETAEISHEIIIEDAD
jgi:putative redox protein